MRSHNNMLEKDLEGGKIPPIRLLSSAVHFLKIARICCLGFFRDQNIDLGRNERLLNCRLRENGGLRRK